MATRDFNYKELEKKLQNHDSNKVNDLITHLKYLQTATKKDKSFTCKWFSFLDIDKVIILFNKAISQNLHIDGKHIIIENRAGQIRLSYDYIAYKNKLLTVYPSAKFDFNVVYKGDDFSIAKKDGKVYYDHKLNNPFDNKDENVTGVYCIIKIDTGDFFITLDIQEINQLRSIATSDDIWKKWFKDMCIKSAIKKIVSKHFDDIYTDINQNDNDYINLENPIDIELELKQRIEKIEDIGDLKVFYQNELPKVTNKNSFIKSLSIHKKNLITRDNVIIDEYTKLLKIKETPDSKKLIQDFSKNNYLEKQSLFEKLKSN
tara:strand:- start:606 stop:1556 length:951 start_codon:yes stop_codon:yes gene_type:complete